MRSHQGQTVRPPSLRTRSLWRSDLDADYAHRALRISDGSPRQAGDRIQVHQSMGATCARSVVDKSGKVLQTVECDVRAVMCLCYKSHVFVSPKQSVLSFIRRQQEQRTAERRVALTASTYCVVVYTIHRNIEPQISLLVEESCIQVGVLLKFVRQDIDTKPAGLSYRSLRIVSPHVILAPVSKVNTALDLISNDCVHNLSSSATR